MAPHHPRLRARVPGGVDSPGAGWAVTVDALETILARATVPILRQVEEGPPDLVAALLPALCERRHGVLGVDLNGDHPRWRSDRGSRYGPLSLSRGQGREKGFFIWHLGGVEGTALLGLSGINIVSDRGRRHRFGTPVIDARSLLCQNALQHIRP
jgi:hypothetical protein